MRSIRVFSFAVAALLALATTAPPAAVASDEVPTVTAPVMLHPAPIVIDTVATVGALDLAVLPALAFEDIAAFDFAPSPEIVASTARSTPAVRVDTVSTSIGSASHARSGLHARDRPGRH